MDSAKNATSKKPSFQFYPGDWLRDPDLKPVSYEAQGVYINVLCLMALSEKPGVLVSNGNPWTLEELADSLKGDPAKTLTLLDVLLRFGLIRYGSSRGYDGVIFNGRMARDNELGQIRAANGDKGKEHGKKGGRPKKPLENGKITPSVTPNLTPRYEKTEPLNNPPSTSTSSSTSFNNISVIGEPEFSKKNEPSPANDPLLFAGWPLDLGQAPDLRLEWTRFEEHCAAGGRGLNKYSRIQQWKLLLPLSPEQRVKAVTDTMAANQYTIKWSIDKLKQNGNSTNHPKTNTGRWQPNSPEDLAAAAARRFGPSS